MRAPTCASVDLSQSLEGRGMYLRTDGVQLPLLLQSQSTRCSQVSWPAVTVPHAVVVLVAWPELDRSTYRHFNPA